jgi:hypothetical protein
MAAARLLSAVGVNVTLMTHELPAATCVPQVLVCAKSPAAVPVMVIPPAGIFSAPVPVLLSVTGIGVEATFSTCPRKFKLAGDRLTTGVVPVPVNATGVNGAAASLAMVIAAVWVPVAVG